MSDQTIGAVEQAAISWHRVVPDWVQRLAQEIEATSQNRAAKALGYSPATISQIIRNKYPADSSGIEERVRGIFMAEKVDCPALGLIPRDACQDWRKKGRNFAGHNPLRVRMARACRDCPNNRKGGAE